MNSLTDQQLQELLDAQFRRRDKTTPLPADEEDVRIYQRLFEELASEPPQLSLSYSFAANVTRQIQKQALDRSERRTFVLYGLSVLFLIGAAIGVLTAASDHAVRELTGTFARLGLPMLLTLLGLGLIQWADYRLVKRERTSTLIFSKERTS
ncbi:hypothetical protein [Spirosoma gilvum]